MTRPLVAAERRSAPPPARETRGSSVLSLDDLSEDEPYRIQLRANGIDVVATLEDAETIDRLVQSLQAVKVLIKPQKGSRKNAPSAAIEDGSNECSE